jgi:hypothetical protein
VEATRHATRLGASLVHSTFAITVTDENVVLPAD